MVEKKHKNQVAAALRKKKQLSMDLCHCWILCNLGASLEAAATPETDSNSRLHEKRQLLPGSLAFIDLGPTQVFSRPFRPHREMTDGREWSWSCNCPCKVQHFAAGLYAPLESSTRSHAFRTHCSASG